MGELKKSSLPVVQVEAGCVFFMYGYSFTAREPGESLIRRAEVLARGMDRMGIDAINIGGRDLAAGLDVLQERLMKQHGSDLPFISANIVDAKTGKLVFPAYRVIGVGKIKVGIFGVMKPSRGLDPQVEVLDPQETAIKAVSELKDKVDFIVALADMGLTEMVTIVDSVEGINVAVVTSGTISRDKPEFAGETAIVSPGSGGKHLGIMKINYSSGEIPDDLVKKRTRLKRELSRLSAQEKILTGPIQEDPEFKSKADEFNQRKIEVEKELAGIPQGLVVENTLFSVKPDLPKDPVVADWVDEALGRVQAGVPTSP